MKRKSKIRTIVDAFTKEPDVTGKDLEFRREQCKNCPFMSENAEDLSLEQKIIKHTTKKPFCTKCGCFTDEKTGQSTEACALEDVEGETPKWNRLKVQTIGSNDFDIINKSPERFNVGLTPDESQYQVDFGDVVQGTVTNGIITLKHEKPFTVRHLVVNCSCTSATKVGTGVMVKSMDIILDVKKDTLQPMKLVGKYIEVHYTQEAKEKFIRIAVEATVIKNQ